MKNKFIIVIVILVLSYLEYRLLINLHSAHIVSLVENTINPLYGHAAWRAWQNRLLCAWIIKEVNGDIVNTFYGLIFICCTITNTLTYFLFKNNRMMLMIIGVLFFLVAQDERWLLGWDLLDMVFMTALLIGIDRKWNDIYFAGIFMVAIFNRETALFIPAWMMFDGLLTRSTSRKLISVALIAFGIGAIYILRETPFYYSNQVFNGQVIGTDSSHINGNHFWLWDNLTHPFTTYPPWMYRLDLIPAIIVATVAYFAMQWNRQNTINKGVILLLASMVAVIVSTAVIHETRCWFITLPFILYLIEKSS